MIERIEIVIEPERYLNPTGISCKVLDVRIRTDSQKYGYRKVVPESDIKSFFRQIMEYAINELEEKLLEDESEIINTSVNTE